MLPKKPRGIGLLATHEEVEIYLQNHRQYKKNVIEYLLDKYSMDSMENLVLYMAETFEQDFIIHKKRGAKTKWNELLNCLVAHEIQTIKSFGISQKTAIYELLGQPRWQTLVKYSIDQHGLISKANKAGKKSKFFSSILKYHKFLKITNTLDEWNRLIDSYIEEAMNS